LLFYSPNADIIILMLSRKFFYILGLGFLAAAGWLFLPAQASAQVLTLQQLEIDDSIVKPDSAYSVPTSIVVVPIFAPDSNFNMRDLDWYRGLYYFLTASQNRAGFTDIPFHYVVSSEGRIYKGNSGGEERKINIEGIGDSQVVVGYLAGSSDTNFDSRSEDVLGQLVISIAGKNGIKLDKISVASVDYVRNDESQTVSLKKVSLFGVWATTLKNSITRNKYLYSVSKKEYKLSVVAVNIPKEEVTYGDVVTGTISLKNTGEYGIYPGTISEVIANKVRGNSQFYDRKTWLSNSQFPIMDSDDVIRPGDQVDLTFSLHIPLVWGQRSEQFNLGTLEGKVIQGTVFEIELDVKRPKGTIVEVRPTETGWLRVRATPSGAATEIARISTGQRYFQVKSANNGWVQLDLGDGKKGWASTQYLKYL
jgi:hypothetical protein